MTNPFEKRATEYFRDDESFLSAITPAPLTTYIADQADRLYDRLVMVSGSPGSGKTTLAQLVQYSTVTTLLKHIDLQSHRDMASALADCGVIRQGEPAIVGCRVPLGSEYRDFWEFPYAEEIRGRLLESILQARACLAWLQNLLSAGHKLADISIRTRADATAAAEAVSASSAQEFFERARQVERAIYQVSAALIPPLADDLPNDVIAPYRPFDVIESIEVNQDHGKAIRLQPLVVLDDAHELHVSQFAALQAWLVRRELRVARWMMTRLDALSPEQVLKGVPTRTEEELKRVQTKREITEIRFQASENRSATRKTFQRMAKDMSGRYLRLMPLFARHRVTSLESLLGVTAPQLTQKRLQLLQESVDKAQIALGVSKSRRAAIKHEVSAYASGSKSHDIGPDVQVAMERILLNRYTNRVPTGDLFDVALDPEPRKDIKADSSVAHGARIQLLHEYDRAYYYGIDCICDSGSENAELFLLIAARLVKQAETKIIRSQPVTLTPREQHNLLRQRASEIVDAWHFPEAEKVKTLVDGIAVQCLEATLEPNAPLGAGANAYGILEEEFERVKHDNPTLARALQFGVAYNAFHLVRDHKTKNKLWCLIELSGPPILHHGLPLVRGGFVEGHVKDLLEMMGG